jgi:hypothetical protein
MNRTNPNGVNPDNGSLDDLNPDNEFRNSIPAEPEIELPNPSTATPAIPPEVPVREDFR